MKNTFSALEFAERLLNVFNDFLGLMAKTLFNVLVLALLAPPLDLPVSTVKVAGVVLLALPFVGILIPSPNVWEKKPLLMRWMWVVVNGSNPGIYPIVLFVYAASILLCNPDERSLSMYEGTEKSLLATLEWHSDHLKTSVRFAVEVIGYSILLLLLLQNERYGWVTILSIVALICIVVGIGYPDRASIVGSPNVIRWLRLLVLHLSLPVLIVRVGISLFRLPMLPLTWID